MCPYSMEDPLYKWYSQGLRLQKEYPNPALTMPMQKTCVRICVHENGCLRRRKWLFGLTRTDIGKALSPCCKGSRTMFGRQEYSIRAYLNEAKALSERSKGTI